MKFKYIYVLLSSIIIILATLYTLLYYYTHNDIEKSIDSELVYVKSSDDFVFSNYPYQVDSSLPNKIVVLKPNLLKPNLNTLSLVFNGYPDEKPYQRVIVFKLYRDSLFSKDFKVELRESAVIKNISFEEAVNLVTKYDITTNFDGKEQLEITNYSPDSEEEIQVAKDSEQQIKDIEQANKLKDEAYNSLSPEEKIKDNDSKIKLYSEAVNQLNQGIVVYIDGTPIDSGDFNVYDKVERGYVVEYYQEYITQLEEKNRELRDG